MGRVIQGYCIRPHMESLGKSAVEKEWRPEPLRRAAPTLAGCEVTDEVTHDGEYNRVVGEVVHSSYVEGKGVRYEAEITDEDAMMLIERGVLEPAPRLTHESIDSSEPEPIVPQELEFDSLFLTEKACECVPKLGPPGMEV